MNAYEIRAIADTNPDRVEIGPCRIVDNFGSYTLSHAVWTPENGGTVTGLVVRGGETNRLCGVSRFTDHAGTIRKFMWCALKKVQSVKDSKWAIDDADDTAKFDLQFL